MSPEDQAAPVLHIVDEILVGRQTLVSVVLVVFTKLEWKVVEEKQDACAQKKKGWKGEKQGPVCRMRPFSAFVPQKEKDQRPEAEQGFQSESSEEPIAHRGEAFVVFGCGHSHGQQVLVPVDHGQVAA